MKIWTNERNVTNFGYVFVPRFHITRKNFPDDLTNSRMFLVSICRFKNGISEYVKKIEKILMDFEQLINLFEMKKRISYPIIYWTIILFVDLLITFRHYDYVE